MQNHRAKRLRLRYENETKQNTDNSNNGDIVYHSVIIIIIIKYNAICLVDLSFNIPRKHTSFS